MKWIFFLLGIAVTSVFLHLASIQSNPVMAAAWFVAWLAGCVMNGLAMAKAMNGGDK